MNINYRKKSASFRWSSKNDANKALGAKTPISLFIPRSLFLLYRELFVLFSLFPQGDRQLQKQVEEHDRDLTSDDTCMQDFGQEGGLGPEKTGSCLILFSKLFITFGAHKADLGVSFFRHCLHVQLVRCNLELHKVEYRMAQRFRQASKSLVLSHWTDLFLAG